ncbi:MAG TPA: tail fiber protein [Conexibacter sp.]|jgi:microcystin-dependent protein
MPYTGEIRLLACNFAPVGWLLCQGQTLEISLFDVLFTLIGTTYGGDGIETFNLPNLQGRVPVHQGQGTGLSRSYQVGESYGVESVALNIQQIPTHTHPLVASTAGGSSRVPTGQVLASPPVTTLYVRETPTSAMASQAVLPRGQSLDHENRMPTLAINFAICTGGVLPTP